MAGSDFEIRDPIHDMIGLSPFEVSLIDTQPMQRLRRIKQLAFTYLVYPSALHTRFEHSLGTCHLASQMANKIDLSPKEIKAVRCAALLHDLGHAPFSHVGEEVIKSHSNGNVPDEPHSLIAVSIAEKSDPIRRLLESGDGPGIEEIKDLLIPEKPSYGSSILKGQVDSDRMDYLLRDSHHTGVTYGTIDRPRILGTVCRAEKEGRIAFKEEGLYSIEQLILARYHMRVQVYMHKTRVVADAMAIRGIDQAIKDGLIKEDFFNYDKIIENPEGYLRWDDDTLAHAILLDHESYAGQLFTRLRNRELLPTVVRIPIDKIHVPDDDIRFKMSVMSKKDVAAAEVKFAEEMKYPRELTIINVQTLKSPTIPAPGGKIDPEGILILDDEGKIKGFNDCAHSLRIESKDKEKEAQERREDFLIYGPEANWRDKPNRPRTSVKAKEALLSILGDST